MKSIENQKLSCQGSINFELSHAYNHLEGKQKLAMGLDI